MTRLFDGNLATRQIYSQGADLCNYSKIHINNTSADPPGQSRPPQIRIVVSIINTSLNSSLIAT